MRLEVSRAAERDLAKNARKRTVSPYLILFRTQGDTVRIERVLHGMRDLPRLLK